MNKNLAVAVMLLAANAGAQTIGRSGPVRPVGALPVLPAAAIPDGGHAGDPFTAASLSAVLRPLPAPTPIHMDMAGRLAPHQVYLYTAPGVTRERISEVLKPTGLRSFRYEEEGGRFQIMIDAPDAREAAMIAGALSHARVDALIGIHSDAAQVLDRLVSASPAGFDALFDGRAEKSPAPEPVSWRSIDESASGQAASPLPKAEQERLSEARAASWTVPAPAEPGPSYRELEKRFKRQLAEYDRLAEKAAEQVLSLRGVPGAEAELAAAEETLTRTLKDKDRFDAASDDALRGLREKLDRLAALRPALPPAPAGDETARHVRAERRVLLSAAVSAFLAALLLFPGAVTGLPAFVVLTGAFVFAGLAAFGTLGLPTEGIWRNGSVWPGLGPMVEAVLASLRDRSYGAAWAHAIMGAAFLAFLGVRELLRLLKAVR